MVQYSLLVCTVKPSKKSLRYSTGNAVLALRKKSGLNQQQFWSLLGVTQSGGSRYENGRNIPKPVQILVQLAYGTDREVYRPVGGTQRPAEFSRSEGVDRSA
jgi:transcriptional regulator with XRE-family HTH domain